MAVIYLLTVSKQYNTYNLILRLMAKGVSCIPSKRRQRKINNILCHTTMATYTTEFYESYIPKNQTYKHNPINDSNDINVDFITNSKFMLLQLRQCKFNSRVFIFKLCNNLTKLVHFMHHLLRIKSLIL